MKKNRKTKPSIAEYHLAGDLGVLGRASHSGATKEVTLGRWGDNNEMKLDIRKWDGRTPGRGISLTEDEVRDLRSILSMTSFGGDDAAE